jgi:hypothetical protein
MLKQFLVGLSAILINFKEVCAVSSASFIIVALHARRKKDQNVNYRSLVRRIAIKSTEMEQCLGGVFS